MAKNLKLNIKNAQIAEAINLGAVKAKLAKKKAEGSKVEEIVQAVEPSPGKSFETEDKLKEDAPRIKARSHSVFAESPGEKLESESCICSPEAIVVEQEASSSVIETHKDVEIVQEKIEEKQSIVQELQDINVQTADLCVKEIVNPVAEEIKIQEERRFEEKSVSKVEPRARPFIKNERTFPAATSERSSSYDQSRPPYKPHRPPYRSDSAPGRSSDRHGSSTSFTERPKLGPTGKHINDILPPRRPPRSASEGPVPRNLENRGARGFVPHPRRPVDVPLKEDAAKDVRNNKPKFDRRVLEDSDLESVDKKAVKAKGKDWAPPKPVKKVESFKSFDGRDRLGLRDREDDVWRKKRPSNKHRTVQQEDLTIRPTKLKVRLPIALKDLAVEMKLKASQLLSKLFLQGVMATLNDFLDDEMIVQLLGHEFGCEIVIDTTEEERIRITDKSIQDEIDTEDVQLLQLRPPIVAFMGHVDHGKTSLIDAIRSSNRAAGEAGAITQHIGAFRCKTSHGDITILDTPGHEAFNAMRARGAEVTDIVVLVIAGDEGIKQQTIEAIQHARDSQSTIVVALNKCDKPNFNADTVYRQLSEQDLLPESWGGQVITVSCSATTGQGLDSLLEMLAIQAEILELKANPFSRARGSVLESEMHKGLGSVATVLVQNGTLKIGDALVFGKHWGRVKTMKDEHGREVLEASPSTPVAVTGLSGLPEAGEEFIVVKSEKEARQISEARSEGQRQINLQLKKKVALENVLQQASANAAKKILNIVLRADVQGSLEAMKTAFEKIQSNKVVLNIISFGVGEISESDVQLAAASQAVIFGFHSQIESHAEALIKQMGVQVKLHDIIYHAVDDAREIMKGLLDKIAQENDKGSALVKAVFKSSHLGNIAGCQVIEGSIVRNNSIRIKRNDQVVWKGGIASLKRVKEDVREVQKGLECGVVLQGFGDFQEGDVLEAYETIYLTQDL